MIATETKFARIGQGMKVHRYVGQNLVACNGRTAGVRHGVRLVAREDVTPTALCGKCFPEGMPND